MERWSHLFDFVINKIQLVACQLCQTKQYKPNCKEAYGASQKPKHARSTRLASSQWHSLLHTKMSAGPDTRVICETIQEIAYTIDSLTKLRNNLCAQISEVLLAYSALKISAGGEENDIEEQVRSLEKKLKEFGVASSGRKYKQCSICKAKVLKRNLLQHKKRHSPPDIECKTCGKCFHSKSNLNQHAQIHREGRLYCDQCGRAFSQKHKLVLHKKKDHAD